MDATTSAVTTGVIVTAGRWCEGKGLSANVVIGAGIFAIMLSVVGQSQPKFAGQVGALVLWSALALYIVPIGKTVGFLDKNGNPTVNVKPTTPTSAADMHTGPTNLSRPL